ncbi:MAG: sialate O-acetylesterase, partial [Planctomycetota bacterium]
DAIELTSSWTLSGRNSIASAVAAVRAGVGIQHLPLSEIEDAQTGLGEMFPSLSGKKLEFAGLFWFQGWNDQYNGAESEYADNMRHFIDDVRKDLKTPKLPVVIAMMGQNMSKEPKGAMKVIQDAQKSMEQVPEFSGNVKAVRTDVLVDKAAEELYPTWKDNFEQWEQTGSDHPYHYLGSAIWYTRIGRECAKAMIELQAQ